MTDFTTNPYPTYKGFGLRVCHAEKAIKKLACDRYADIYTRGFDNCFENGDGSAVVWTLMHKAHADSEGNAPLTRGIQIMFSTTLDGNTYPQCWLLIPITVNRHMVRHCHSSRPYSNERKSPHHSGLSALL